MSALQPRLNSEAERIARPKPKARSTPSIGDNPRRLAGKAEAMSDPTILEGRRLKAEAKAAMKRGDRAEAKRIADKRLTLMSEYHRQKIQEALKAGDKAKASRQKPSFASSPETGRQSFLTSPESRRLVTSLGIGNGERRNEGSN